MLKASRRAAIIASFVLVTSLGACSGGEVDIDPPSASCSHNNVGEIRKSDGAYWQCVSDGHNQYFWTILNGGSLAPTAAQENAVIALAGSEVVVVNDQDATVWTFDLTPDDEAIAPPVLEFEPGVGTAITTDPSSFVSPVNEQCVDDGGPDDCVGLTLHGTGSPASGTINTSTGEVSIPLEVVVDAEAVVGFPGLGSSCQIGPIEATLTGDDLDPGTGTVTLTAQDIPLDEVTTCGDYNDLFNNILQLPGSEVDISINGLIGL